MARGLSLGATWHEIKINEHLGSRPFDPLPSHGFNLPMSKHAYLNYHLEYTQTHSTTLVKVPLSISKDHAAPSTVTFLIGVPGSTEAMQTSAAAAIHSGFKVVLFSAFYMNI